MLMWKLHVNLVKNVESWWLKVIILETGGHHKGKRGKDSENKQPTLLILSTLEDNNYPQYVKLHTLPNYKGEPIEEYLKEKCLFDPTIVINCDRDKAFFA